jgi:glycosyltransferase involved in cell wall biosynthesis
MRSKQKVCWVVASPLTIRFFLLGQIAALGKNYDLTVITHADDPEFLADLGVPVRVIPVAIMRNVSLCRDLMALLSLVAIFHREKFDLVHTLSPKTGLLGMVAAWLVRVPLRVHVFQGEVWATRKGWWRLFLKTLDKWMARCATHLLVVSHSEEAFLVDQGVVPSGRLKMLASGSICGVDLDRFRPDAGMRNEIRRKYGIAKEEKVILYVGRLTREKGLLDLADAFARLAPQYPTTHLLVVGPDEERVRETVLASYPAVRTRMHFSDYTPNPERHMAASDILCLPSYREGFGLVLVEAAAVGVPTVGSRIYGISDAVQDGVTGLLFRPGDVVDLAEKIRLLLDDVQLAHNLGEAGRLRARREFGSEFVLAELLTFYKRLLTSRENILK